MRIADWSDERLTATFGHDMPGDGLCAEIVRLRGELYTMEHWGSALKATRAECVALASQVAALEHELKAYAQKRAMVSKELYGHIVAERDRTLAQVAALRSVGARFFDFIAGLEAFEHGNGDGDRLAGDLEEVLADTSKVAEQHDADLVRKERGMVACLHNALTELATYSTARPHQWQIANKALVDGAAMAAEHDAQVRAEARREALELAAREFESFDPEETTFAKYTMAEHTNVDWPATVARFAAHLRAIAAKKEGAL